MDIISPDDSPCKPTPETVFIYKLIDPRDNAVRYIGKTDNLKRRMKGHLSKEEGKRNTYKSRWINSLKSLGLKPIMQLVEEVPFAHWEAYECFWIAFYRTQGCNLTNTGKGGLGGATPPGWHHSPPTKEKMRAAKLGKKTGPRSEEHNRKIAESKTGKKYRPTTEKARHNLSEGQKKRKHTPEDIEKSANGRRGQKRTPEQCLNMSLGHKNSTKPKKKQSPEHTAKSAATRRGAKRTPEQCTRMSIAAKNRVRVKKNAPSIATPSLWD